MAAVSPHSAALRVALVPGHACAGDRFGSGWPAGDGRPLHVSAHDRFAHCRGLVSGECGVSEALANLALCRDKQGDQTEAITLLRRAIQARPTATAHYDLANLLAKQNQPDESETNYRAALNLKPDFVEAWYNLGNLQAARG